MPHHVSGSRREWRREWSAAWSADRLFRTSSKPPPSSNDLSTPNELQSSVDAAIGMLQSESSRRGCSIAMDRQSVDEMLNVVLEKRLLHQGFRRHKGLRAKRLYADSHIAYSYPRPFPACHTYPLSVTTHHLPLTTYPFLVLHVCHLHMFFCCQRRFNFLLAQSSPALLRGQSCATGGVMHPHRADPALMGHQSLQQQPHATIEYERYRLPPRP